MRRPRTLLGLPESQWQFPPLLLQDKRITEALEVIFWSCPKSKSGIEWHGTGIRKRLTGYRSPAVIPAAHIEFICQKLMCIEQRTRQMLYHHLAGTAQGNVGLEAIEMAVMYALSGQENSIEPLEWILLQSARHRIPQSLVSIVDTLLRQCTVQWKEGGNLDIKVPPHFPRSILRDQEIQSCIRQPDIQQHLQRLPAVHPGLRPIQSLLEELTERGPDALSAEHIRIEQEISTFKGLREYPPSVQQQFRSLALSVFSKSDLTICQKTNALTAQPPKSLHQGESDSLIEAYRGLQRESQLRVLETSSYHGLFSVIPETLATAFLRKRNPDQMHLRETLLILLSHRGVRTEVIAVLEHLAKEWTLAYNEHAARRGDLERAISFNETKTYNRGTLERAATAAQTLDEESIREASTLLPLFVGHQLLALKEGNYEQLVHVPDPPERNGEVSPALRGQQLYKGTMVRTPKEEPGTSGRKRRHRPLEQTGSQNGDERQRETAACESQRMEEQKEKKILRDDISRYLHDIYGKVISLREAKRILREAAGILHRRVSSGKHSKEFYDPKGGGRHMIAGKILAQNEMYVSDVVGVVYGHDGQQGNGIGDLESFHKWVTSQKDYHPRKSIDPASD